MRDRFLIYTRYLKQIAPLSNEQRGILFTAILSYMSGEDLPPMDAVAEYAFGVIRADLDTDGAKYDEKCRTNSENGRKGGLAKADILANASERQRTLANGGESSRYDMTDKIEGYKRESKPKRKGRMNSFNNFPERVYDYSDLEAKLKAVDSNREDLEGYAN